MIGNMGENLSALVGHLECNKNMQDDHVGKK